MTSLDIFCFLLTSPDDIDNSKTKFIGTYQAISVSGRSINLDFWCSRYFQWIFIWNLFSHIVPGFYCFTVFEILISAICLFENGEMIDIIPVQAITILFLFLYCDKVFSLKNCYNDLPLCIRDNYKQLPLQFHC